VNDNCTFERLATEVARASTSRDMLLTLLFLFTIRGAPMSIRSKTGLEFISKELQAWLSQAAVRTLYIQKASPWENGYVESFNSRLRDELLNRELFLSLAEARVVLDLWRIEYNQQRPHRSLSCKPTAALAANLEAQPRAEAQL